MNNWYVHNCQNNEHPTHIGNDFEKYLNDWGDQPQPEPIQDSIFVNLSWFDVALSGWFESVWWFVDFEVCWMLEWASVGILSPIKGLSHFGLGCFLRFSGLVDLWFGGYLRFSWPLDPLRFGWLWGLIDFKAWLTLRFGWLLGLVDFEADVQGRAVTLPI